MGEFMEVVALEKVSIFNIVAWLGGARRVGEGVISPPMRGKCHLPCE